MLSFDNVTAMLAPIAIAIPIVMACVLLVAGRRLPRLAVDVMAIATALAMASLLAYLLAAAASGRIVTWAAGWTPATATASALCSLSTRSARALRCWRAA